MVSQPPDPCLTPVNWPLPGAPPCCGKVSPAGSRWAFRNRTCDGVHSRNGEGEDGGQVEIPAQADVNKQGSCIQVNLGKESWAEVRHRSEMQGSESGAGLTGFVTRPQPSLSLGVPGERNRDTPHKLFITWWVVEGGRENWLWTAVCHVQMYGECYCQQ